MASPSPKINPTKPELERTFYAMTVLTSIIFITRAVVRARSPKKLGATDIFLTLAYIIFIAETILYIVTFPRIYRMDEAAAGIVPMYATFDDDIVLMRKVLLINSYLLWSCLWAVKGSFLSIYLGFLKGLPKYYKLWWAVVVFVVLAYFCNVPAHLVSCRKLDFFVAKGCNSKADVQGQLISLYYSFSADVTTDLAVMFLPLFLIRKLQVDTKKKLGIAGLFCIGLVCIVVATIRVVKLGEGDGQFVPGWLAMWGVIESAIAVIIGCGPGLYVTMKEVYRTRAARTYGTDATGSGSARKWYAKDRSYNEVGSGMDTREPRQSVPRHIPLEEKTGLGYELTEMRHARKDGDEPVASSKNWVESENTRTHGSDQSVPEASKDNQLRGGIDWTPRAFADKHCAMQGDNLSMSPLNTQLS